MSQDQTTQPLDTYIDGKKMPEWWGPFWAGVHQMVATCHPPRLRLPSRCRGDVQGILVPEAGSKNIVSDPQTTPAPRSWRLPHLMWGLSATMQFPKVTRTATHYGIVWGPWFLGFVHGGKQHVR